MLSSILLDIFAVVLRFFLSRTFLTDYLQGRPEISNPLNSMVRVKEGVALFKDGISPYEGDIYHGTPLLLLLIQKLSDCCPVLIELLFPICDLITAVSLQIATKKYLIHLKRKENTAKRQADEFKPLLITDDAIKDMPVMTKLLYLYNPLSVVTCVAHCTTTLNNAMMTAALALTLSKHPFLACFCVAIASYNELYPFVLIAPIILWFSMDSKGYFAKQRVPKSLTVITGVFALMIAVLFYVSSRIMAGWGFLEGTYGFILSAEDLTPNPGLFWYFFTEMFDHFRSFFMWVFQMNPIVYVAPLSICLRDDAVVLWHQLVTIITIFKSYPSIGDAALVLSFLPAFSHLSRYIRHRFIISVGFAACMGLAPIMWYLWIYAGSANANFYFAVTLVYSTAHIFLLTDLLYAYLRRQVHLKHGLKPKIDGEDAIIILK